MAEGINDEMQVRRDFAQIIGELIGFDPPLLCHDAHTGQLRAEAVVHVLQQLLALFQARLFNQVFGHTLELFVGGLQRLFGRFGGLVRFDELIFIAFTIGDVENLHVEVLRADAAGARTAAAQNSPDYVTVRPDEAFLHRVAIDLATEHLIKQALIFGQVIRVCDVGPGFGKELFPAVAENLAGLIVDFDPAFFGRGDGGADQRQIEEMPEYRFTLAEFLFKLAVLRDVDDAQHPNHEKDNAVTIRYDVDALEIGATTQSQPVDQATGKQGRQQHTADPVNRTGRLDRPA